MVSAARSAQPSREARKMEMKPVLWRKKQAQSLEMTQREGRGPRMGTEGLNSTLILLLSSAEDLLAAPPSLHLMPGLPHSPLPLNFCSYAQYQV